MVSSVSAIRSIPASRRAVLAGMLLAATWLAAPRPAAAAEGTLTYAVHISLAPTWFEPAETSGIITPFMVLYALHDSMLKAMPGQPLAPSLAESWSVSEDGLIYTFVVRAGATFHNGDPVTAEDVAFSFKRYRGTAHDQLQARVVKVETPDPQHAVFTLKEPWPDFPTFYATATGAGWVVPKTYIERVGDDGFKKAPIGAGPYKFVSFTPGVALVLEAYDGYWRKKPSVKRLVFKVIPDESTRLAALKRGEVDVAYSIRGELADELETTPGLSLKGVVLQAAYWLQFPEQWDPKSPWHDIRVRQAASLAIDRKTISEALTKGVSLVTNTIIPDSFEYFWKPPEPVYDRAKAKALLAEAGHPNGFDAGDYYCDVAYANLAEAVINDLQAVGIRARLMPLERVAFYKRYAEKGSRTSSRARAARSATPRPGSRPSWSRAAPTSTATSPTSTPCTPSRRPRSSTRTARRPCMRCRSWSTSARCSRRSGSSAS